MENQALTTMDGWQVANRVDPQTVDNVISISDDDILWLKVGEAGFLAGDSHFSSELAGIIFDVKPYFIKWTIGEKPDKAPFTSMDDQPEGYELRCDIKLSLSDGELVGLSMAPSSARNFSRYMKRLKSLRLPVGEVITIMTTRSVLNKNKQKFCLLDFNFTQPEPGILKAREVAFGDDEIPF